MEGSILSVFFYAFGLLFLSELGDKTQLVILTLSSKGHSSKKLALGATLGFLAIVALGGLVGIALSRYINLEIMSIVSGIIFIAIGLLQIYLIIGRKKEPSESEKVLDQDLERLEKGKRSDVIIGFFAIFIMEMGDKTQILTILLAASSNYPFFTLLGAWMALSLLAVIGAFAGGYISEKLPKKWIDRFAAALFLTIGIIMLIYGVS